MKPKKSVTTAYLILLAILTATAITACVRVTAISDKCKYVQVDMGGAVDIVSHDCSEKPR